jgi:hypothetical protein
MWDIIDKLATIISLFSVIIAAWSAWKLRSETKRQWQKESEQICIILRNSQEEIKLAVELQRGNLNRAELLGLIGMLPMQEKSNRFHIDFLSTHDFSQQLARVRNSDTEFEFIVKCEDDELEQFRCNKLPICSTSPNTNLDEQCNHVDAN